jgi:hypothetical protein
MAGSAALEYLTLPHRQDPAIFGIFSSQTIHLDQEE